MIFPVNVKPGRITACTRQRARVAAQVLVLPAETTRQFFPLASRGGLGLAGAYLLRPLRLAINLLPAGCGGQPV